ncbi:hypothetical protein [Flavivirga sp. 57AJ16]|uniref:hypothetical protein n=1 Tax=Flavivirga sp. 57AJ16 TaxID=3025307 RepID=UPI0023673F75|nr:hypothetical protein [Flavivirga sp. 57AJ16]MDD7887967.1 hypothetical protein [Flavivirga sp. 57AJ16]
MCIPKEIQNLTSLAELYLYDNQLVTIPKEIGTLYSLQHLYLYENPLINISRGVYGLKSNKATLVL